MTASVTTQAPLPTMAPGMPILGHALDVVQTPMQSLSRLYQKMGPVFRVRIPGQEFVVLAGPEANVFYLRHEAEYFRNKESYKYVSQEVHTSNYLLTLDGEAHSAMRRTLRPAFSREAIAPYFPQMVELVQRAAQSWQPGQSWPVKTTLQALLLDELSLAMANSHAGHHLPEIKSFSGTFFAVGLALYPPILLQLPGYRSAKKRFEAFLQDVVARHRSQPSGEARKPDLVDHLMSAHYPDGRPLSEADILAHTNLPFLNSFTYIGRVTSFLIYALMTHPDLMDRATEEADAAFADGIPDIAALRQMKVLRLALLEALRLYPVAVAVIRHVAKTFEFKGYRVEAGQTAIVGTSAAHFVPELYPDPYTFDIERFNPPRSEHQQPGAYAPFGAGAHTCISVGLIETTILLTVATLLHSVRLQMDPPDYKLKMVADPLSGPDQKFHARVVEQRTPKKLPVTLTDTSFEELSLLMPGLSAEQVNRASAKLEHLTYSPGAVIIRQGDPPDKFYIISQGAVEVVKEQTGKEPVVVATLKSGHYFGEIGLLQGIHRTATVRVPHGGAPVQVLALDRDSFTSIVAESDLTSAEIAGLMRQRELGMTLAVTLPTLTTEQATHFLPRFEVLHFTPGSVIITQGDSADKFYMIMKGRVEVSTRNPNGQDIVLGRLESGEYFGEIGLLQGSPRTATIRAAEDNVEVMALDRDAFMSLLNESQQTHSGITAIMAARLEQLNKQASQ